jgi:sterol desaturase/sphingolipid hydroxylase (fatty acid hydroxylase superfamily)
MAIQTITLAVSVAGLSILLNLYGLRPQPLFDPTPVVGVVGSAIISAFVYDFFYYWLHRAQHRFPILWRFHAVHHSVQQMSAPCGYGHFTEAIFDALLVLVPVSFFVPPKSAAVIAFLVTLQGMLIHSSTRLNFGQLGWFICDARMHRIHHSLEPQHWNRNFGSLTLIWDRIFGTAVLPQRGEWPDVGLDDQIQPETMRDFLFRPFRAAPQIQRP